MVCPKIVRCMGAALAAALACCCAAQTTDFLPRLAHGEQLRLQDRYQEARTVFLNLLRDMRNDQSNQRLEALVEDNLGLDDQDRGDYAGAETAYNHGVDLLRGEPVYDSVMIDVKTHLAELYLAENRPRDAESLLREGRTDASHAPKPASMQLATLNEDLAVACIMRRKLSETEGLLREAQALVENTYGPDSPRLSSSLFSYAGLLVTEHKYDEAIPPAERAWHILAHSTLTIPKPYVASALSVMGMVYYHAGRLDQAEEYARKSVDLAEASLGARHPRVGLYLWNYALILRTAGRKNEAKAAQKKADAILDQPPSSSSGGYTVNVDSLR